MTYRREAFCLEQGFKVFGWEWDLSLKDIGDSRIFEFGDFRLNEREQLLLKRGEPVSLTPKAFHILMVLVESHGHVVLKEDLLKKVWSDTFVEESNVTWNIHSLRRALGETGTVKFIATIPKVGFRFVAAVTEVGKEAQTKEPSAPALSIQNPSVAVLPFRNLDRDSDSEYFSDGLTEEVINSLANIQGLRVAARTSSFAFKSKDMDIRQIGQTLGVTAVLEGSVRKSGTHVRVTAQLINVADGYHMWSEGFERQIDDIFKIQEQISRSIAEHMITGLRLSSRKSFAAKHTTDFSTYNSYLLGRFFWNKRDGEGVKKSIEYFQGCLKTDPKYAPAYAGLADSYNTLGLYRILPPHVAFAKAHWAATKALEIDDSLAEPYTALGIVHIWYNWKWYEGEDSFRRSIQLNPEYATAHQWYALSLPVMGRIADGVSEMEHASRLEPLSLGIRSTLAWTYYLSRQYDLALTKAEETVGLDSAFLLAHFYLGLICVQKKLFDRAIEHLGVVAEGTNNLPITVSALIFAHAAAGKRRKAQQLMQHLRELSKQQYVSAYDFALAHTALEQFDEAFDALERALDERGWMNHLHVEPMLDGLRNDPRFPALLRRMGVE